MKSKVGYVYILTNPAMPGIIKIGYTNDIGRRLRDLDTTGVPQPYEPFFSVKTSKYELLEKVIHRELDKLTDTRLRTNREFFKMEPDMARDLLLNISRLLDDSEVEDYGNVAVADTLNEDGSVRPVSGKTTFAMLGIPVGSELEPVSRRYVKVVTLNDDNLVRIVDTGEQKTISRAAMDSSGSMALNGFSCYRYNGEKLSDIRKRIDKNYLPSHHR